MLTLYLVPHQQPLFQPNASQIEQWSLAVQHAKIARRLNLTKNDALSASDSIEHLDNFVPDYGMIHLFDQDAQETLLPAELTFESLSIHYAPEVTFLPLSEIELRIECRQCGDDFELAHFYQNLKRLHFESFRQLKMWCQSCQMNIDRKGWYFEQDVAFAKFWIQIKESASTRLNPILLKAWGDLLGHSLAVVAEQKEESLSDLWQRQGYEDYNDDLMTATPDMLNDSWGIKPSRHTRTARQSKWIQHRSQQSAKARKSKNNKFR
jgi:hypothetical protein